MSTDSRLPATSISEAGMRSFGSASVRLFAPQLVFEMVRAQTGSPYYGFGCSAHSFDGARRRWANERDVLKYVRHIEECQSPIVEHHDLTPDEQRAEAVFLGMRLMNGLRTDEFEKMFGIDLRVEYAEDLHHFQQAGLIEIDGNLLKLTRTGALLSNEVFAAIA